MAKVIIEEPAALPKLWASYRRTILSGVGAGILFWIVALLLEKFVITPIACSNLSNAAICMNPEEMAGNIATIVTAVLAAFALVKISAARPIIIAVASAALLWSAYAWTDGLFWLEALAWSVVLYVLSYALFAWITRSVQLWLAVLLPVLIVLFVRIAVIL